MTIEKLLTTIKEKHIGMQKPPTYFFIGEPMYFTGKACLVNNSLKMIDGTEKDFVHRAVIIMNDDDKKKYFALGKVSDPWNLSAQIRKKNLYYAIDGKFFDFVTLF